jgi:hypothetical protein
MIDEKALRALIAEAENEVRHRLRRQPFPKPQFVRGVQSGVRWLLQAIEARLPGTVTSIEEQES